MIRFRNISIKRKLTLIIMAASTVALLMVAGGFVTYELITYRQGVTHDLSTLGEIIGDRSSAALSFEDKIDAEETLGALRSKRHITAAALYNKDGQLFAQYASAQSAPGLFPLRAEKEGVRFEKDHLLLFHEIRVKGEPIGTLYLKTDLLEMHQRFKRYSTIVLAILLTSILVTYLLSAPMQRIISGPIFHLAETARAVSLGKNYSVRATKQGNDELGQLIDVFNEMLGNSGAGRRFAGIQR